MFFDSVSFYLFSCFTSLRCAVLHCSACVFYLTGAVQIFADNEYDDAFWECSNRSRTFIHVSKLYLHSLCCTAVHYSYWKRKRLWRSVWTRWCRSSETKRRRPSSWIGSRPNTKPSLPTLKNASRKNRRLILMHFVEYDLWHLVYAFDL